MNTFTFELHQMVEITASGETGKVVSRAEHTNSRNNYRVRYRANDGRAVEAWWDEDALAAAASE